MADASVASPASSSLASPAKAPASAKASQVSQPKRVLSQYFKRFEMLIELKSLQNAKNCPLGVYVSPSLDNVNLWHGILFMHGSFYPGGAFRFRLEIPNEYPDVAPRVVLDKEQAVHHPLVDPRTGEFSLAQQFGTWRPLKDYLCHVLQYLRRAFTEKELQQLQEQFCLNKEALRQFHKDRDRFMHAADDCAKRSVKLVTQQNDNGRLVFALDPAAAAAPIDNNKLDEALRTIFKDYRSPTDPGKQLTPIALRSVTDILPKSRSVLLPE